MLREDKRAFIESMRRDMDRAAGVLFLDYTGLTVEEADRLRRKIREGSLAYKVVKNTLMTRVLSETPYAAAGNCLKGTPTAVVLGFEDPVAAAKLMVEFAKECEHVKIKGGVVDKKAVNAKEAEALSKMPNKAEIQASVIGLVLSPSRKLIAQIKSPAGRIVGAVDALVEKETR